MVRGLACRLKCRGQTNIFPGAVGNGLNHNRRCAMAKYERVTAAPVRDVLGLAEELLKQRLPLTRDRTDSHSIVLRGGDGEVQISVHRHGHESLIHACTDQLGTSRLDLELQYVLSRLPYQPGDVPAG